MGDLVFAEPIVGDEGLHRLDYCRLSRLERKLLVRIDAIVINIRFVFLRQRLEDEVPLVSARRRHDGKH